MYPIFRLLSAFTHILYNHPSRFTHWLNRIFIKIFNLETGEEKLVIFNLLQAMFIGMPRLFTLMVANSLFLEQFSAKNLSYVYLVASLVVPITGFLHLYFAKCMSFINLNSRTLIILSIFSLTFLGLLTLTQSPWVVIALYVWMAAETAMTDIVLWGTANRLFTVRQSKRLFGLIGSGLILTVVLGGFLTPWIVTWLGTRGLLLVSSLGLLFALINLQYINHICGHKLSKNTSKTEKIEQNFHFLEVFKNRYIILIFLFFALFSQVIYYFIDNIFYLQVNHYFPNADELASFIGQFWAVYGLLSLTFRSLIAGRWITKVGLFGGMLTAPVAIGSCLLGVILTSALHLPMETLFIFWLIALTKLFDRIFTGAVTLPAYHTLYQPLPLESRGRIQTITESIVGPIGGLLTSLLLLFLTQYWHLSVVYLSLILLIIILLFIIISLFTIQEYRHALATALQRRGLMGMNLSLDDAWNVQILENGLQSHRPQEILYCLKLLEKAKYIRLKKHLFNLINHENLQVREGVYQTLERLGYEEGFDKLQQRLQQEQSPRLVAALLRALAATGENEAFDMIEPYLQSADKQVKQGAMVALIRYCGIEGAVRAGSVLMELRQSPYSEDRQFAATVLGEVGISSFYRSLLLLLKDDDLEVRKAALIATAQLDNKKLWPLVIDNLVFLPTREVAINALLRARELAFPALEEAYAQDKTGKLKREIIHIYGKIKSKQAITLLLKKLSELDRNLRSEILWSLYLCGYQAETAELANIDALLTEEAFYGVRIMDMQTYLAGQNTQILLIEALNYELQKVQGRIFLLLTTIYSPDLMMQIWTNFREPSLERRDLALELLDNSVNKTHKAIVLPVLEGQDNYQHKKDRQVIFQWLMRLLTQPAMIYHNSWIRACAVDATAQLFSLNEIKKHLQPLFKDKDDLVQETVNKIIIQTDKKTYLTSIIEKVKILRKVSIFSKIPDEILAEMAHFLEGVSYTAEEVVFQKGELGTSLYIVAQGRLQVYDEREILAELGQGHIFGEFSAIDPEHRTASVKTLEKSYLFKMSQQELNALIEGHLEVAKGIIQILCQRLRNSLNRSNAKINDKPLATSSTTIETQEKLENTEFITEALYHYPPDKEEGLSLIEKVIILKTVSIFSDAPDHILSELAHLTREIFLKKGELLFNKGEVGTSMYIVVSGSVKVHNAENTIAELGERSLLGEMAVLSSEPRTASVTAITDTVLLSLSQTSLAELMWDQHQIVRGIIRVLIQRLRSLR